MEGPPRWVVSEDRTSTIWMIAAIVIAGVVAAGAAVFLLQTGSDDSPTTANSTSVTRRFAVSAKGLATLAGSTSHPIYWAGPRDTKLYEVTQASNGDISLRYLPRGGSAGDPRPLLSIATYPSLNAYGTAKETMTRRGNVSVPVGRGALAFRTKRSHTNVYVAFRGQDVQVEVFSPKPGQAQRIVEAGQIVPVK
jgi:hypothetical protein